MIAWCVYYMGLPDMQYKDVLVYADTDEEARDKADAKLLAEYGMDNFDCLLVKVTNYNLN